jgi:hypothetical protein
VFEIWRGSWPQVRIPGERGEKNRFRHRRHQYLWFCDCPNPEGLRSIRASLWANIVGYCYLPVNALYTYSHKTARQSLLGAGDTAV